MIIIKEFIRVVCPVFLANILVRIVMEILGPVEVPYVASLPREETIIIIAHVKMGSILKGMIVYPVKFLVPDVLML